MAAFLAVLPLIAPLITAGLPVAEEIIKSIVSGIEGVNAAKTGAKLTPEQAALANANATKIAQTSLAAKVATGKITQAQLDAALPDAVSVSKAVQMLYDAGPMPATSSPTPQTKEQLKAALLAAYLQADAVAAK